MAATYKTILTNTGLALDASAQANGTQIQMVAIAVGDGGGNPTTPSAAQTALVREVYRNTLNAIAVNPQNPNQYTAEVVIPADVGGFTIREAGLYTADGDLFAVANVPATYKPQNTEGAFGDTVIRMVFETANASTVNLAVDTSISVATRTWVMNYAVPANIIPGGLTNQVLAKHSNTDGDVVWKDASAGVVVIVDSIEERQTLAAGQTAVTLSTVTANGLAVYVEGVRLRGDEWTKVDDTHLTLAASYPDGSKAVFVQNEQTGLNDVLHAANNLSELADKNVARDTLGAAAKSTSITAGTGLVGGGDLSLNRTLSVNFAASGVSDAMAAVRADDERLSDARTPLPHTHAAADIVSGTLADARVAQSNVTQYQAALTIAQSQVTGLAASLAAKLDATANAVSASKLQTARTIALGGLLGGSATFDGSGNVTIAATMADNALSISKTSGLQTTLDAKVNATAFTSNVDANAVRPCGIYGSYGSGAVNGPSGQASGVLMNFAQLTSGANTDGAQLWQGYNDGTLWHRQRWGNTWGSWCQVCTSVGDFTTSGKFTTTAKVTSVGHAFGNNVGSSSTDLSKHLDLYGGAYGVCVTGSRQNYVAPSGSTHVFVIGGSDILSVNGAGVTLTGSLTASGGFQNSDRRLKTNITPRQVQRGFALKIARMFCEWDRIADGIHDVGLIAQRVKRLASRYVKRGDDKRGLLAIDKAGIALEASMDNALHLAEHEKTFKALLRRIEKLEKSR